VAWHIVATISPHVTTPPDIRTVLGRETVAEREHTRQQMEMLRRRVERRLGG